MAASITSTKTAEHYTWGADCDGWHLVKAPGLSVIEELMPPGTSELRHYHLHSRQFFYVLTGVLTLEVDGQELSLQAGHGIEVPPSHPHQAFNRSSDPLRMLVISQPPTTGDRITL